MRHGIFYSIIYILICVNCSIIALSPTVESYKLNTHVLLSPPPSSQLSHRFTLAQHIFTCWLIKYLWSTIAKNQNDILLSKCIWYACLLLWQVKNYFNDDMIFYTVVCCVNSNNMQCNINIVVLIILWSAMKFH